MVQFFYGQFLFCFFFFSCNLSVWLDTTLTFLCFTNWEDRMGWFVRFTLIIARQCLLHIACALIIILIAKLVCVFSKAFLRYNLKWQALHILGQIVTHNWIGMKYNITWCNYNEWLRLRIGKINFQSQPLKKILK